MIDMKYDKDWDWTGYFEKNTPEIVAQQAKSRLMLWLGEWFLDTSEGTPWLQDVIGRDTNYDLEIQSRILSTTGVIEISDYSSSITNRLLQVNCAISTIYGTTPLSINFTG